MNHAVERVAACVKRLKSLDFPFALTARAENLIRGVQDVDDTIRRLQAYEKAGADVLYAPGLMNLDQVQDVLDAISLPLNVLASFMSSTSLDEYLSIGVRRISVGSYLANYAIGATLSAATQMSEQGRFDWVSEAASGGSIKRLLS
jgi:2-methylisocitrate lyase-like PEP mutase family enzyme